MSDCYVDRLLFQLFLQDKDINYKDNYNRTLLMKAICNKDMKLILTLIKAGIDINAQTNSGCSALLLAIQYGSNDSMKIVRLLINAGVNVNIQNKFGWTALMEVVFNINIHNEIIMHMLLNAGVNINTQQKDGFTALMYAIFKISKNSDIIIRTLINSGADIYIKNKDNDTAFDIAVKMNNRSAVNILQQYKDNWIFNPRTKKINQLILWSEKNIQSVRDIHTSWREDKQSGFGKLPWVIIRDIILPMTIDRKDTVKLIKKKKEDFFSSL